MKGRIIWVAAHPNAVSILLLLHLSLSAGSEMLMCSRDVIRKSMTVILAQCARQPLCAMHGDEKHCYVQSRCCLKQE